MHDDIELTLATIGWPVMKIKDIGGEFALIDQLSQIIPAAHAELVVGMGDDAAVIRSAPAPSPYLLVTTDILVEESHFRRAWATPEQIGIKAAECNISDIAAMGGTPTWMFVSLVLTREIDVEWVKGVYAGIARSCRRCGVIVAGGDTTLGAANTINITLLGSVLESDLCLRSQARAGDLLMVTGMLGASAAALALLLAERKPSAYLLEKHLAPTCRLDVSRKIAPLANAMIDISDGLGSEIHHICRQSHTGAYIEAARIPIHPDVRAAAADLGKNPLEFALSGGEDFELLFSIAPDKLAALEGAGLTCHQVGRVLAPDAALTLIHADGSKTPMPGGFDHFT
jgi:thiamine-monophosphate kinase